MNELTTPSSSGILGAASGSASPTLAAGSSPTTGHHSAHLTLLRDELRDSVMEEERLLDKMAELAQTRSSLKVQVQRKEAEAEIVAIRRRQEKLQAARQALRL